MPRFFKTVILFLEVFKKAGISDTAGLRFSSESALKSDSSLNSRICSLEMSCRIETECLIFSSSLLDSLSLSYLLISFEVGFFSARGEIFTTIFCFMGAFLVAFWGVKSFWGFWSV